MFSYYLMCSLTIDSSSQIFETRRTTVSKSKQNENVMLQSLTSLVLVSRSLLLVSRSLLLVSWSLLLVSRSLLLVSRYLLLGLV